MNSKINMLQIITVVTEAVDVINPILKSHHRRVAVIAYNIGKAVGLGEIELTELVMAAALHDIGALTVADAKALTQMDVENPEPHSQLGAAMLSTFAPFHNISKLLRYHHVDWSDKSIDHESIPSGAYILHLADRIEINTYGSRIALNTKQFVLDRILGERGRLFAPQLVDVFLQLADKEYFWFEIDHVSHAELMNRVALDSLILRKNPATIEALVYTLSRIIDMKSSFTSAHSKRVAHVAYRLAEHMALPEDLCWEIKMAGYMHDIGKIAVPSEIIVKPSKLTEEEFNIMKSHPYYTYQILKHVEGFERIAAWAGAHHEKTDKSGYPRKPDASHFCLESEIITYADVFAALAEERPYRHILPLDQALAVIELDFEPIIGRRVYPHLKAISVLLYEELKAMDAEHIA